MEKLSRPVPILAGIVILAALIVGGTVLAGRHDPGKPRPHTTHHTVSKAPSSTQSKDATPSANTSKGNTAASDTAIAAHNPTPVTAACQLLSERAASQILGSDAKQGTASDTSSLRATDTTLTACAYTGAQGSVQLTIRTPTGSVGTSENATVFGSDKPANAVPVQGYGQSAYWDPGKQQLNVLGSNNWYIITRAPNTQAGAEAAAKVLATGF